VKNNLFRIIDANLNRAREGLRVCEDIARFSLQNKDAAKTLKRIRHGATNLVLKSKKVSFPKLLSERDTAKDKTKFIDFTPGHKTGISDVFMSNIERVKESLRVLEECFKIIDEKISRGYRKLRFDTYDAEKRIVKKTGLISCNR
jgi:hypothetical protein